VLGPPPAFVLSQDQTLQLNIGNTVSKHGFYRNDLTRLDVCLFTRYSVFRDQLGVRRNITTSLACVKTSARFVRVGGLYLPGRLDSFLENRRSLSLSGFAVRSKFVAATRGILPEPIGSATQKTLFFRKSVPVSPARSPYALSRGSQGNDHYI
jgi:hypothetical protein